MAINSIVIVEPTKRQTDIDIPRDVHVASLKIYRYCVDRLFTEKIILYIHLVGV